MNFEHSEKVRDLIARLEAFMDEHVYPNEERFFEEVERGDRWEPPAVLDELKPLGRREAGGVAALPMWMYFFEEVLEEMPEVERAMPAGLVSVRIDRKTGRRSAIG